jgi:hypothetical protein
MGMRRNVGTIDKLIRVIAGAAIIALGVKYNSWWGVLGAIPIVTAALSWCPLYSIIGIKTCRGDGSGSSCCCGR